MCQDGGGLPRFQIKPDVSETMNQLMEALMGRVPRGNGDGGVGGSGGGAGGSGGDGYSVSGDTTNVPVYGPDRLAFSQEGGGSGQDGSSGSPLRPGETEQPRNQVNPEEQHTAESAKFDPERVPEKYRGAVKRYFTEDAEAPTP
jgi:hypothetical protein